MLQTGKGIFGAVAIALTLGAVQFASGQDLTGRQQANTGSAVSTINRDAKADRGARLAAPAAQTQTISLQLNGLSDTSVLVRIPAAGFARSGASAPSMVKSGGGTTAVACEPMVSVLTEVAKQLAARPLRDLSSERSSSPDRRRWACCGLPACPRRDRRAPIAESVS